MAPSRPSGAASRALDGTSRPNDAFERNVAPTITGKRLDAEIYAAGMALRKTFQEVSGRMVEPLDCHIAEEHLRQAELFKKNDGPRKASQKLLATLVAQKQQEAASNAIEKHCLSELESIMFSLLPELRKGFQEQVVPLVKHITQLSQKFSDLQKESNSKDLLLHSKELELQHAKLTSSEKSSSESAGKAANEAADEMKKLAEQMLELIKHRTTDMEKDDALERQIKKLGSELLVANSEKLIWKLGFRHQWLLTSGR